MKILLLSAYDASSHRYWHQFLKNNMMQHQWQVHTLPARHFSWRIRGNSLAWAFDDALGSLTEYDCLVATSMVDLSSLRGMRPELCQLPTALYFHENQFSYPVSKHQHKSLEPQMVSIYSAISADFLVFNSQYNRDTFLHGVDQLLRKFPDCVPKGVVQSLEAKSRCIAVPLQPLQPSQIKQSSKACSEQMNIVWNHRWEYDKGPELLAQCIEALPKIHSLRFHIVGQGFRNTPDVFAKIKALLESRNWLGEWGFIENRDDYQSLLLSSDVVLSTAIHDFQGLSVLEAVAAGCVPVLPNRLVYPEWFSGEYLYADDGCELENLCGHLLALLSGFLEGRLPEVPDIRAVTWAVLKPQYQQLIAELADCDV